MRHLLSPRSRLFRSLSILALLAWTAFAFDAFAHPLVMSGSATGVASMSTSNAALHCEGLPASSAPHTAHRPAPTHAAGNGHGCCHNGGCYCASLCSGVVGISCLGVALQPAHDPAITLLYSDLVPAPSAPPLRPPIA